VPDDLELSSVMEALVYRVAQEAVRNIVRHARASHVQLSLQRTADRTVFAVADDGVGFWPDDLPEATRLGHVGLRGVSDLAAQAGAVLKLSASPGRGTRLHLELPTG
jgi:two-component system NarL family sensor kinase